MKPNLPYYTIQVATNKDDKVQERIAQVLVEQLQTHLSNGDIAKAEHLKEHFGIPKELADDMEAIKNFIMTEVVLVAKENVEEIRNGKKRANTRKMFASYVFIRMKYNNEYSILISRVPNIVKFIGMSNVSEEPEKVLDHEITRVLRSIDESKEKAKRSVDFARGDKVRIKTGPFSDFDAEVLEVDYEKKNCLQVSVRIFGRETSVSLDFSDVDKHN